MSGFLPSRKNHYRKQTFPLETVLVIQKESFFLFLMWFNFSKYEKLLILE